LRDIYRVAGHRVGFRAACPEPAGDDLACVDADMQTERRVGEQPRTLAEALGSLHHVERRMESPFGIVLMCCRCAEQCEQGIA
jgi:hypothetical protein